MAEIAIGDVEKIATLAKLRFSDDEKETYRAQLQNIITYVEKLNELDTEGVEPTFAVQHTDAVLREDEVKSSLSRDEALANAPARVHGYFRVPKVISQN